MPLDEESEIFINATRAKDSNDDGAGFGWTRRRGQSD